MRPFPCSSKARSAGAAILHQGAGSFEGQPAWIGVIHLPQGSARFTRDPGTGLPVRADSYRGLAVFSRGGMTFMIMTEIDPQAPWSAFLPQLTDFYRGMAFTAPFAAPDERQVAAIR